MVTTLEILQGLLDAEPFGVADLDLIVSQNPKEDQYLEFKDGKLATEKSEKELKRQILFHVTGFANAVGGVLVVGVSEERPRQVTGAKAPGNSTLAEWAARILTRPLGGFSPPPRIEEIAHPNGNVLVIAVGRAPQLVPYVEAGEIRYALRLDESTVDVAPFLISDLLLGRRNHPVLELRDMEIVGSLESGGNRIRLTPRVTVDNASLPASVDTTIAIVSWSRTKKAESASDAVRRYVEATPPPDYGSDIPGEVWTLRYLPSDQPDATIRAYERLTVSFSEGIRLPRKPVGAGTVRFGLCIMPRQSPPAWYQVRCRYSIHHEGDQPKVEIESEIKRSDRPHVTWSPTLSPTIIAET